MMGLEHYQGLNWTASCFNTSIANLKSYNHASSISSIVAFFPTLGLLVVIFAYNSYSSILHRLLIYFTLSIMTFLAVSATDLQLQYQLDNKYCRWTGYTKVSVHMISLLFSSEICAHLICKMYFQIKYNKKLPRLSKWRAIVLEIGLVAVTVLSPPLLLLLAWNSFGLSSTVCWIQLFKSNSCIKNLEDTNHVVLSLTVIKGCFFSFNFLGYSILIGLFCWLACKSEAARKQYFSTARRTVILIFLMIFTSVTDLITLFIFVYMVNRKTVANKAGIVFLSAYYATAQCIQPIAYLFYLNTVKKFQWDSTRIMARRWKSRGMNCWSNALRWFNPFPTTTASDSDSLFPRQPSNLDHTPALTSSMSYYGTQRN